jgi:4-amino-4-deoxy-L-arabinose transferase-like glycosyltransferase
MRDRTLLAAILLLALLLRLPGLDRWPPAIHQDEASNGVDGWSLLTTGADRSGRVWPVFLEGFGAGDNRTALYAYLTLPVIAVFGPGTVSTRLPATALGVVTVLALYGFMRRIRGERAAAVASLLLAVNPWHIYLSRYGHEASLTPAFLPIALWLIAGMDGEEPVRPLRSVLAGLVLGVGLYSYPSYRLFLPLFVVIAWVLGVGPGRNRRGLFLLGGFLVAAVPLMLAGMAHPERFFARASFTSILGNVEPLGFALLLIARQYLAHYLPTFLFWRGDGNLLHSPPGGQLLWIELIPLILGIFLALRRRDRWDRLILLWLLLYPIASAVTLGDRPEYVPHSLRAAVGLPVFQILGASGIVRATEALGRYRPRFASIATALFGITLIANVGVVAWLFTGAHARAVAPLYHAAYPPAMRYLAESQDRFTHAAITAMDNSQAYIYAILFGLQSPADFQQATKQIEATETFHLVKRVDNLLFVHASENLGRHRMLQGGTLWAVVRPGQLRAGRVVAEFPLADGTPGLEIREVVFPSAPREETPATEPDP